jgi:DNA-binding transcriptional ArsR family regulator
MSENEEFVKVLKALSSNPRLEILEYLRNNTANPIKIARDLKHNPSTVEQHLKILVDANLLQRNILFNDKSQKLIVYNARSEVFDLINLIRKFIHKENTEMP